MWFWWVEYNADRFTPPGTMVCFPALRISSIFLRPLHDQLLVFPLKRPLCSRLHYIKYSYWVELQTTYLDYTFFFYCYPYNTQMRRQKSALGKHLPHASREEARGGRFTAIYGLYRYVPL